MLIFLAVSSEILAFSAPLLFPELRDFHSVNKYGLLSLLRPSVKLNVWTFSIMIVHAQQDPFCH